MPLDRLSVGTETAQVVFAIRRHTAPGETRGVLVLDHAREGQAGIASADRLARGLGDAVRARWDVVVPDRRGTGHSGGIDCPLASATWRAADRTPAGAGVAAPTGTDAGLMAAAAAFSRDCVAEIGGSPDRLRFLGTRHAAEDLESLRLYLDAPQLMLFGASDGATLLQQYAAAHPAAVAGLILDAPRDPATRAEEGWFESARAHEDVLGAVLAECTATPACARAVGGDAGAAFDALALRLADGPVTVDVPGADGAAREVVVTLSDLGLIAAGSMATELDRMLFQRAIAAASQGRWWHLARMLALLERGAPDTSEAARTAIACADRALVSGGGDPAAEWLRIGRERGIAAFRTGGVWATDLPCATWPVQPGPDATLAAIEAPSFASIVMGATLDPVAPWTNGERIAERLDPTRASTIVTTGGSHGTWGRGSRCPDRSIAGYLSFGRPPRAQASCTRPTSAPFVPLGIPDKARTGGTRAALSSADREISASSDRLAWDGRAALRIGCPHGGTIAFRPGVGRTDLRLRECQMTAGVPLTGTGAIEDGDGALSLEVESGLPGVTVTYHRSGGGEVSVTGRLAVLD